MKFPREDMELSLFTKYLKLSGLWFDKKRKSKYLWILQWSRLLTSVVSLAVWDWGISRVEPKEIPQKPYAAVLLWLNLNFLCMLNYTAHHSLVEDFVLGMSALLRKRTHPQEVQRFQELTSRLWKVITVWITCHCSIAMIAVSCGYIIVDTVLYIFGDPSSEPFYIGMTLEAFLPEKKVRDVPFYALGLLNTCLMLIPTFYHIALLGALPITVTYVYFEFEVLKKNIHAWFANINNQQVQQRMLQEIVDDYCELIRLSRMMKTLLGFFYLLHCFITVVTLGFLFHLFKKAATKGEMTPLLIATFFIVTTTLVTYIACYIGEKLHEEGQKISTYIYQFEWYTTSPETMKTVKLIMMQSQMPLSINFKNRVELSLETFTEVMNKGYTLFLLLDSFNL